MQILICEGCKLREHSCIVLDENDQCGYPGTCIYDLDGTLKRKWDKISAGEVAVYLATKGIRALFGDHQEFAVGRGTCSSCGKNKVLNDKGICFECSKRI